MLYEIALGLIALILVVSFILYCDALVIVYCRRSSPNFSSFFFRMWWNQCFLDLFMLIFFTTTIYTRCFEVVAPLFLHLNSYPIWTKFAMITQEQIMYIQSTNVLLAVCVRLLAICAPASKILKVIEQLSKWKILLIQVALPTAIAIPFYSTYDFRYGLNEYHIPLRISATNISYEKCIFAIGLFYRTTSMVICLCGYFLLFLHLHRERSKTELNVLVHGLLLVIALAAVIVSSVLRRRKPDETRPLMGLFYLTSMLWIPSTNILATIYTTKALRSHLLHPLRDRDATTTT